jgi:protein gp37
MSSSTTIEWTEATWNPVTGCTKISAGCENCYAERMTRRLKAMGQANYADGFAVAMHPDSLAIPLRWRRPRRVFVNSMSDIFHERVTDDFLVQMFTVMAEAGQHRFQLLTKRPERIKSLPESLVWPTNVWLGTTVERADYLGRIDVVRQSPAAAKFLSLEPLLGPLHAIDLEGIDWVIVGGESGPGARTMDADWVHEIKAQCVEAAVPFFFKQWGGVNKKKAGRILDGREWNQMPGDLD